MRCKRQKSNMLRVSDGRGFTTTISIKKLNKVKASVNTNVEEYLIDAHLTTLNRYRAYLLAIMLKRNKLDTFTRQFLSIGRLKWNLTKIYRKVTMLIKLD